MFLIYKFVQFNVCMCINLHRGLIDIILKFCGNGFSVFLIVIITTVDAAAAAATATATTTTTTTMTTTATGTSVVLQLS